MAEKKICFTVASDENSLTVKSVQIGNEEKIDIGKELTGENVGDIAANIVTKGNASALPPPPPVPEPVPVVVTEPVPVVVTVPETAPETAPVANSVLAASTTPANVPVVNLSTDDALTKLKGIQLTDKYKAYTLGSLIEDLKRDGGERSYGRGKLLEFITRNAVDWYNSRLMGEQITKAIVAGITEAGQRQDNWNIGFHNNNQNKRQHKLVLGGSHLTRKSSYNRRRRQSTTRKGRRSSRRRR